MSLEGVSGMSGSPREPIGAKHCVNHGFSELTGAGFLPTRLGGVTLVVIHLLPGSRSFREQDLQSPGCEVYPLTSWVMPRINAGVRVVIGARMRNEGSRATPARSQIDHTASGNS